MEFLDTPVAVPPTLTLFVGHNAINLGDLEIPSDMLVRGGYVPTVFLRSNTTIERQQEEEAEDQSDEEAYRESLGRPRRRNAGRPRRRSSHTYGLESRNSRILRTRLTMNDASARRRHSIALSNMITWGSAINCLAGNRTCHAASSDSRSDLALGRPGYGRRAVTA